MIRGPAPPNGRTGWDGSGSAATFPRPSPITWRPFGNSTGAAEIWRSLPRFYPPDAPRLAAMLARPQDRLALWEKNLAEAAALAADLEREGRTSIRPSDGYGAFRAVLPPPEKRALALIDLICPLNPPTEWTDVMEAPPAGDGQASLGRLCGLVPFDRARAGARCHARLQAMDGSGPIRSVHRRSVRKDGRLRARDCEPSLEI